METMVGFRKGTNGFQKGVRKTQGKRASGGFSIFSKG
jgi:hypothetical protein